MSSPKARLRAWLPAVLLAASLAGPAGCATAAGGWPAPAPACPPDSAALPTAFESAFRAAAPAVVRVLSLRYRAAGDIELPYDPFLPMAAQGETDGSLFAERSAASGFIVSPGGLVLGSAHSVLDAAQTWVELSDGQQLRARVIGTDRDLDLALLKVEAQGLPVLALSVEDPRPGQWVAALGAPFGFEHSMSSGMVSAFPRELPGVAGVGLIQTDVAINPGSSGGPLLNACGQVIGMSAMVFSVQGLYVGVTFAIPARRLLRAGNELLEGRPAHGSAGLRTQSLTPALARAFGAPDAQGAVVVRVEPGGAAARAGLREGDIVIAVDGTPVAGSDAVAERLAAAPGRLALDVWREGARRTVALRLPEPPAPPAAAHDPHPAWPRLGLRFARGARGGSGPQALRVVAAEGAGMLAGIDEGDDVAAVNGRPVSTVQEFDQALASARAAGARTVALLIEREGVRAWVVVRADE